MEFKIKNPLHIFAGLMVSLSLLAFIVLPILSAVGLFSNLDSMNQLDYISDELSFFFEIFMFIFQILFVIILFVLVPFIWYKLVNNFTLEQMLDKIRLKKENLDMAILWGLITAIAALSIVIAISLILTFAGFASEDTSNIEDLELFFSVPLILLLITFQPIAEEIFFRGFLLDKFEGSLGMYPAIVLTSLLFGLAHISMGNVIPAIIICFVALLFGYAVVKTNNLMTGIIAHVIFNVVSFVLYMIGKEFVTGALML